MSNTLINNKVMGETIGAKLPAALRFGAIAEIDSTLQGQAGDTIKVDSYTYIGEASDVLEGAVIPITDIAQTTKDVTIKKAAKGVKLTDEEVKRKGQEVVSEVEKQLTMSIKDKVDSDCYTALALSALKITCLGKLSFADIVNAKALFQDEEETNYALYINPLQEADVLLAVGFIPATALGDQFLLDGAIGRIGGADVIKSIKVKKVGTAYKNILAKAGALGIKLGKDVFIEEKRDAAIQTTEYYSSEMYVPYIKNDKGVVTITTKEA